MASSPVNASQKRHISKVMANIIDRMTKRLRKNTAEIRDFSPSEAASAPESAPAAATAPAQGKGAAPSVDARRVAEQKAEEAGRRWRAAAEARGEGTKETGGPQGLEPTRYGDWEKAGRCIDF